LSGDPVTKLAIKNWVEPTRTFGWIEKHWNGSLLDLLETMLEFTKTLIFKGKHPIVTFVEKIYQTGVKLTKREMKIFEEQMNGLIRPPAKVFGRSFCTNHIGHY
jgi:hypothetical protein